MHTEEKPDFSQPGVSLSGAVDNNAVEWSEAALRRSELRYQRLIENTPYCIHELDAEGRFVSMNKAGLRMMGMEDAACIIGVHYLDAVADFDRPRISELLLSAKSGQASSFEFQAVNGRFFSSNFVPLPDGAIMGTTHDISERKQAEERLRQSDAQARSQLAELETLYNTLPIGLALLDREFRFLRINERLAQVHGRTVREEAGRTLRECIPHLADKIESLLRQVFETGQPMLNLELSGSVSSEPDAERHWMPSYHPQRGPDGTIVAVSVVVVEVTERKRAEDYAALESRLREILLRSHEEEAMFAEVLDFVRERFGSPFGFFGYIRETDGALVCPSMSREIWDQCGVENKSIEFPRAAWGGLWGRVLMERRALLKNEAHQPPKGHVPLVRSMGAPVLVKGEVIGSIHVANRDRDYSPADLDSLQQICDVLAPTMSFWLQRRKAETAGEQALLELRGSEERLRLVVEAAPSAMLMVDERGIMTLVNRQAELLFGYTRAELLGQSVELLMPERLRSAHSGHLQGFFISPSTRAMGAGRDLFGLRKDGREVPIEIGLNPIRIGESAFVLANIIDITERKKADETIKASLREKEALLQEVYHRVKNNLQVVSSLLQLQSGYIQDAAMLTVLRESQDRIRSMSLVHEKLYQTHSLAALDFAEYLRTLVATLARAYAPANGAVRIEVQAEAVEVSVDTAVPLGLIVNELVSNGLKHAFPGERRGHLRVELRRLEDSRVELTVRDDGVGLPPGFAIGQSKSLGLRLVGYMTEQLRGELAVRGEGGAVFELRFRLPTGTQVERTPV